MASLDDAIKVMTGEDTEQNQGEDNKIEDNSDCAIVDESLGEDTSKTRKKTGYRYLTVNFRDVQRVKASNDNDINAWKHQMLKTNKDRVLFDRRNMVYCANPTFDYTMIYNYYMMLNDIYDDWINIGRLDQQYLPYIYSPSFDVANDITKSLQSIALSAHVNTYSERKPTSFVHNGQLLALPESWIKRTDLVKLQQYLEANPIPLKNGEVFEYHFEEMDPKKVSMTGFFKEFIRLQEVVDS